MKDIFLSAKEVNELKETKQNIIIFDSSYFLPNTGINAIDEYNNEHIENKMGKIIFVQVVLSKSRSCNTCYYDLL